MHGQNRVDRRGSARHDECATECACARAPERAAADESAFADESEDALARAHESADVPEQWSIRIRPSTKQAMEQYTKRAKLKKGPTTDVLWTMLMNGDIDLATVRRHVRALRERNDE